MSAKNTDRPPDDSPAATPLPTGAETIATGLGSAHLGEETASAAASSPGSGPANRVPFYQWKSTYLAGLAVVGGIIAISAHFAENEHVQLMLQLFSGNWSPPKDFTQISKIEFAITGVFAIIINWSPLVGAFVLLYKYVDKIVTERIAEMLLKQAFDIYDQTATAIIIDKLGITDPATVKKINEAFREAEPHLREAIQAAFGKKALEKFDASLARPLP